MFLQKAFLFLLMTICQVNLLFAQSNTDGLFNLFELEQSTESDISGDIITYSMEIYESGTVTDSLTRTISFTKISLQKIVFPDNTSRNSIQIMYVGQSWAFYEVVQIKIDDRLYNLTVDSPKRTQGQGFCVEILEPELTQEMVNGIRNSKALVIQINGRYRGIPITIDPNGMTDINGFYDDI